jgi:hypothetical protein
MLMSVIQFQMNEEQRNLPIVFTVEMCSTRGVQILLHCKYTGETLYGIAYTWFNVPHAVYRWQNGYPLPATRRVFLPLGGGFEWNIIPAGLLMGRKADLLGGLGLGTIW